jgi:hypothetical protein
VQPPDLQASLQSSLAHQYPVANTVLSTGCKLQQQQYRSKSRQQQYRTSPGVWNADTPKSETLSTAAALPAGAMSSVGAPSRKFSGLMSLCTTPFLQAKAQQTAQARGELTRASERAASHARACNTMRKPLLNKPRYTTST